MSQEDTKPQGQPKVILSNAGEPFKTEPAAKSARAARGLDPNDWDVRPHGDGIGFAIFRKVYAGEPPPQDQGTVTPVGPTREEPKATGDASDTEKYFWVRFQDKRTKEDPDDVELGVNGEVLQIQRDKWVILPERFLECAKNAKYPHWVQEPGRPRKKAGTILLWPHDVKDEPATREQYLAMKAQGTKHARAAQEAAAVA